MKNQKICFNKSLGFIILTVVIIVIFAATAIKLSQNTISTNTRASYPTIVGGIKNAACFEYSSSSHCSQKCIIDHGYDFKCSGEASLHCCEYKAELNKAVDLSKVIKVEVKNFIQNGPNFTVSLNANGESPTIEMQSNYISPSDPDYKSCEDISDIKTFKFNESVPVHIGPTILKATAIKEDDGEITVTLMAQKLGSTSYDEVLFTGTTKNNTSMPITEFSLTVFASSTSPRKLSDLCFVD